MLIDYNNGQSCQQINQMIKGKVEDDPPVFRHHYQHFPPPAPLRRSYNRVKASRTYYQTSEKTIIRQNTGQPTESVTLDLHQIKNDDLSAEHVYHSKKNAYRNYIRQIYNKINQELRKKNTFLTIASQNIKHIDYSQALITREIKPARVVNAEKDESDLKKRVREKLRLERLQEKTASLEKIKQKIVYKRKLQDSVAKKQTIELSKTQREIAAPKYVKEVAQLNKSEISNKMNQLFARKQFGKQRGYSQKVTSSAGITIQDFMPIKKGLHKKQPFVCGLNEKQNTQQRTRQTIVAYIDFLWKVNYSNGLFVRAAPDDRIYKAYVGPGNNSIMVKTILKRRFWWTISDKLQGCQFVWTQLKVNSLFKQQKQSDTIKQIMYKTKRRESEIQLARIDDGHARIYNGNDAINWMQHLDRNSKTENSINQKTYARRLGLLAKKNLKRIEDSKELLIHNHLWQNYFIGNKKALFYNMKKYYQLRGLNVFDALPLTFHLSKGLQDPQYKSFVNCYNNFQQSKQRGQQQKNIWILKPGQFSNRGHGISVCHSLDDILVRLKSKERSSDGQLRTFIIQKYIEKPLLYKSRKFDIRHYLLIGCFNGIFKAYWYPEGYIRTSSSTFSLKRGTNLLVHLTNDAVQKRSQQYGKYQKGNKISYQKFQNYLDRTLKNKSEKNIFYDRILPEMKQLATNAVHSTYLTLDQKRRQHNFQLLGMDFMIDLALKPWLIEINTNPCLELSSPLLNRLIPALVQNTFRLCVDPLFPPPQDWPTGKKIFIGGNALEQNKFQLIFDESTEGSSFEELYKGDFKLPKAAGKIEQDAQVYQNDGIEEWENDADKV